MMPEPRMGGRGKRGFSIDLRMIVVVLLLPVGLWIVRVEQRDVVSATPSAIAHRLLLDSEFPRAQIEGAEMTARAAKGSRAASAAAVLALSLLDASSSAAHPPEQTDRLRREAESATRKALESSPSQGYLWFALFSLRLWGARRRHQRCRAASRNVLSARAARTMDSNQTLPVGRAAARPTAGQTSRAGWRRVLSHIRYAGRSGRGARFLEWKAVIAGRHNRQAVVSPRSKQRENLAKSS